MFEDEDDDGECPHDECDDDGICLECGAFGCRATRDALTTPKSIDTPAVSSAHIAQRSGE